jgi:hypothetical protein
MKKYLPIALFFCISCKKDKTEYDVPCSNPTRNITMAKSLIIGNWSWTYEKYLNRFTNSFVFKTPLTEGISRRYHFLKNSEVQMYKNNSLIETATYDITTLDVVTGFGMDKEITILLFKSKLTGQRIDFAPMTICNDSLTIIYQAYLDSKGNEKWSKNQTL